MTRRSPPLIDRRRWLASLARAGVGLTPLAAGGLAGGLWSGFARALSARAAALPLQDAPEPAHRFILIFLDGGWNAHLSVDPVYGDRLATGNFQDVYATHELKAPDGKSALVTGIGFQNALPAFASIPTAFVNGMNVEIAAHDAAATYLLTGKAVIGRAMTQPAMPALLATTRGGLASHLVLGGGIPLGDTIGRAPPLQANGDGLGELLSPPGNEFKAETRAAIEQALNAEDALFYDSLGTKAQASLEPFRTSQHDIAAVFDDFGGKLDLTPELQERYAVKDERAFANLAAAFLALKSDLTTIVTVRIGGFDTHTDELGKQLPLQRGLAAVLAAFVDDLRNTPDPRDPASSLADTSTIVLTSEFTRTAKFNDSAGTDHANSASAVVMGRSVNDGVVVGATDEAGRPLGWSGTAAVAKDDATMIDGGALVATLLDLYGLPTEAAALTERRVRGLFS
jgi:uncharacterized protein (DUF1501 family)